MYFVITVNVDTFQGKVEVKIYLCVNKPKLYFAIGKTLAKMNVILFGFKVERGLVCFSCT